MITIIIIAHALSPQTQQETIYIFLHDIKIIIFIYIFYLIFDTDA